MAIRQFLGFPAVSLPRLRFGRTVACNGLIGTNFWVGGRARKIFPEFPRAAGKRRGGDAGRAQLIPSSFAAVPPRIAMRSSSLRPGVDMMWSTGTRFHGNG